MLGGLTVVVPIYNVEKYLNKCIESILNQTMEIDEIILVNDGSKDNSGIIADRYAVENERVKVINQRNGGLSAARNAGIDAATKEFIAFVDADDYIEPTMYETLMGILVRNKADIAIGGVWYEQENGLRYSPYKQGMAKVWNKKESMIELNSYRCFNMSFCDAVFKRTLFEIAAYGEEKLRFPMGKLCEDYYLMHRVLARAETVAYVSTPLYHYVQRENSISRNTKVNLAPMDAALVQLEFYKKWFPELAYIAETACFFSYAGIYTSYCRIGQKCPKDLQEEINPICMKYLGSVLKNNYIPKVKKAQAIIFCYGKPAYKIIASWRRHR